MSEPVDPGAATAAWLDRYQGSLLNVFGRPQLVLEHGDGRLGLGRRRPPLPRPPRRHRGQRPRATTTPRSSRPSPSRPASSCTCPTSSPRCRRSSSPSGCSRSPGAPGARRCSSATPAPRPSRPRSSCARRTGRTGIVAAEGAFHGRTTGALALTHKPAYREPFEPLLPGVTHVPWGDVDALRAAVTDRDLRGRARADPGRGRRAAPATRLPAGRARAHPRARRAARARRGPDRHRPHRHVVRLPAGRRRARRHHPRQGARRRRADRRAGHLRPDRAAPCSRPASTARPSAATRSPVPPASPCSTRSPAEGLLDHAREAGRAPRAPRSRRWATRRSPGSAAPDCCSAITLAGEHSAAVAALARDAGFIVNPVAPDAIRLAPPLVVTTAELDLFVDALPGLLDAATATAATTGHAKDAR